MRSLRSHLLVAAVVSACGAFASSAEPVGTVVSPSASAGLRTSTLDAAGGRRLSELRWRTYRVQSRGAKVRVSPAYSDPATIATRWAAYFDSLLHGSELERLEVYVAPMDEVSRLCGRGDVLGCYGGNRMVIPDEADAPVLATSIAAHEYGHHVANNRANPPWLAIDWGTKRWAAAEQVCQRVAAGTAFPGAQNGDYPLNPGEAFAESYRVLNETAVGLLPTWPIVDPSFRPDATALEALRQDVLNPWSSETVTTRHAAFIGAARSWTTRIATPLDGSLRVGIQPGSNDLKLLAPDARNVLARGAWTAARAKTADYTICGRRSVVVRVIRHSPARRFTLQLSAP